MRVIDGQRRQGQVLFATKSEPLAGPFESGSDDYAGDATTTGVLAPNGSVTGVIEALGDRDWFAVTLVAGETITLTTPLGISALLFDASSAPVALDFFGVPTATHGQAAFTATATGTYYVSVTGSGSAQFYTLTSAITVGDNPNNLSHAPTLTDGSVLGGAFTADDRVDWFRFELAAGETIAIQGSTSAVSLYFYNEFGYSVDSSGGGAFRTITASASGTYYVAAMGNSGVSYQIVTDIFFDDYSDGLAPYTHPNEPAIVALDPEGDQINGVLETGMDRDVFAIYLDAQQAVRITLTDTDGSPTYLYVDLSRSDGINSQSYGGQQAGAGYAELLFTAPVSGIYYLNVSGSVTSYTAAIAPVVDDFSHDNSRTGVLTNGAFRGVFETSGDIDRFTFSGEAGQIVRLDYPGASGGYVLTPILYTPGGVQVLPGFAPASGGVGDATLYRLPETGTYTFEFAGGTYTASAFNYAYNFLLWPHYEIPDSLDFLFPAGNLLLFPVPDPGPTPTVPMSDDETIQRPEVFGEDIFYFPTLRVVQAGETYWNNIGEALFLSFNGSSLTNHGTIWSQGGYGATALNGSEWSTIVNSGSIVAMAPAVAIAVNSGGRGVLINYGDVIAISDTLAATGFQTYQSDHLLQPGGDPALWQTAFSSNHGRIVAISQQGYATGTVFANTTSFENTGQIIAYGLGSAAGVAMALGGQLTNSGLILARQTGDIPLYYLPETGVGAEGYLNFINSGTVDADVAVNVLGILHMRNTATGLIFGDILVSATGSSEHSILINDGLVDGNVFFDIGVDRYEGAGLVTGGVFLGGGNDQATGGSLGDLFLGEDGNDTLNGGGGNDDLFGGAGVDLLIGGQGDDILHGGLGADQMYGGSGDDIYVVDDNLDFLSENFGEGTDTVQSSLTRQLGANFENLVLTGTSAINGLGNALNNVITGNSAVNWLYGYDGNDTLDGGGDADKMFGGLGNDTYFVDNNLDFLSENVGEGTDTVVSSLTRQLGANFENLTLSGSSLINGLGNSLNNVITGNSAVNWLYGYDGNDTLNGGGDADKMFGGLGDDTYYVDNNLDFIVENASEGTDTVISTLTRQLVANFENLVLAGSSAINGLGNSLNNTITGNSAVNWLYGYDGNDTLNGGGDADKMFGGTGDDIYFVDNNLDFIVENASEGTDSVISTLTRQLTVNFENLVLAGSSAINGLGNSVDNVITGNSNVNWLYGYDGNDTLDGGGDADKMFGGTGNDTYIIDNNLDFISENASEGIDTVRSSLTRGLGANFENLVLTGSANINGFGNTLDNRLTGNVAANTLIGDAGADTFVFATALGTIDTITDFNVADDTIELSTAIFTGIGFGALAANAFVIGSAAADADDRIIYNASTGALYYDADGDGAGAAIQIATLATGLALTENDFLGGP